MNCKRYLSSLPRLEGKTIVVTGANAGIGLQTTRHLAALGARVILACRSEEKARCAMAELHREFPHAQLEFAAYDQASFAAIERFAHALADTPLDGLVLNAGICGAGAEKRTVDGHPLIFGTNYLGPVRLVELWREKLLREQTRVVFVSSLSGRFSARQTVSAFTGGSANRQYGYSKLCLAIYACRCMEEGLQAVLVHPGVSGTGILFGQDSALPTPVVRVGKGILDCFPHKGAKPGLMAVQALCTDYRPGLYIRPGLPLGLFGLPRAVQPPACYGDFSMLE